MRQNLGCTRGSISRRGLLHRAWNIAALWPFVESCSGRGQNGAAQSRSRTAGPALVDSVDLADRRTEIAFWNTQTGPKADILNAIVEAFNRSQSLIAVKPEYQGDYNALFKKLLASVAAQQTPDLAVSYPSMVSE